MLQPSLIAALHLQFRKGSGMDTEDISRSADSRGQLTTVRGERAPEGPPLQSKATIDRRSRSSSAACTMKALQEPGAFCKEQRRFSAWCQKVASHEACCSQARPCKVVSEHAGRQHVWMPLRARPC